MFKQKASYMIKKIKMDTKHYVLKGYIYKMSMSNKIRAV